ncbi:hypothetical protein EDC96DRAFT_467139, partial [Choanephora cucurbitarum]
MTPDEEMQQMRQQLAETQNMLSQLIEQQQQHFQAQAAATSDPVDDLQSHLHPFGLRPRFEWTPDLLVQDQFALDRDLFNNDVLSDEARGELIDKYPPIRQLNYQPPLTMPEAKRRMNTSQTKEDVTLKHMQYLLSGTFRPLDILASEICTTDLPNDHSQRFIEIINDIRSLMLNVNASISSSRKDIAFRAINPSFRAPSTGNQNYLMSSEAFQSAISQQSNSNKALKEASSRHRRSGGPSSKLASGSTNPFFRDGPSMDQGGYNNNNKNNNNNQNNSGFSGGHRPPHQNTNPSTPRRSSNILLHGFQITFHSPPPTTTTGKPVVCFDPKQEQLLSQEISSLLDKCAIEVVSPHQQQTPGFYSSMFVIPKKTGGSRPVFNLKALNRYVVCPTFKMETINDISRLIQPQDWMTSIDLSD